MKRTNTLPSYIDSPSSRTSLGGKLSHYRNKQIIYSQGTPADTLFYIREGGVCLNTRSKYQPPVVTAILGAGDFFGELCLVGVPDRVSTAVALASSSIQVIKKESMIRMLRQRKMSISFVSYLLSSIQKHKDHVADLLILSAEQRLARVLLQLAHLDRRDSRVAGLAIVSQQVLAEMVGTTRSRLNFFMNRFRKRGFINYSIRQIEVHKSLQKVLQRP